MRGRGGYFTGIVCFFVYLAVVSSAGANTREFVWKNVSNGIMDSDLLAVAAGPGSPRTIYIASESVIYKTADNGKKWNEVLSFRGTGNTINAVAVPGAGRVVYAGTGDGLYRSRDGGRNWEKIFTGIGVEQKGSVFCIAVDPAAPGVIFIGTGSGLFRTDNGGINWRKGRNIPSGAIVSSIAIAPSDHQTVYAAADNGLYKSLNNGVRWKRMLAAYISEEGNDTSGIPEETGTEETENNEIEKDTGIRSIAVDPADSGRVYLGTSEGLLSSGDGGQTWATAGSRGLISRDIRHIAINPSTGRVYAATGGGVFRYSGITKSWEGLYKGLVSADIRYLSFTPSVEEAFTTLFAATKRGMYKTMPAKRFAGQVNKDIYGRELSSAFAHEPSIGEIREAAIIYAGVHPDKIKRWRKAAASKAWLPDLRVGYYKGKDWQSSTYFYSTSKEKYTDDDITTGKDMGWAVSLTWELGDLIWNKAQTSIDSRARLMVQLRDDILNEVTRLYFERRRLQYEMLLSPPEEIRDKIENELRLQELTADIDALTNSYLSKKPGRVKVGKK